MQVREILRIKGHALFTTAPDAPVVDAVKVMAHNDIGSLIVMDHGRLVGLLTFREVLEALADRDGLIAQPDLEVMELRRVMLERHARYVPVMEGTTLLGVVSFHDVAKAVLEDQSFENQMLQSYINT